MAESIATSTDEFEEMVSTSTLFIVGDIMLGRHVEHLMSQYGASYPYEHMQFITEEPAFTLANFEAAVPEAHIKTPNFGFVFSVATTALPELRRSGVTHVSLANNHSYDYGLTGYMSTVQALTEAGITVMGPPQGLASTSSSVIELGPVRIGVLAISALTKAPSERELKVALQELKERSDIQIAYIHWGLEYVRVPSAEQRALARNLGEYGVHLVIGHHPHVVQSIEKYDETIVFYSLGNFIFDQYFSSDVQQGLALKLGLSDANELEISLIPVSSEQSHAQPRVMSPVLKNQFLKELADLSSEGLKEEILAGKLLLGMPLATSTEIAIMDQ
jgi:poly-gamma-glutamate synthesis protein (capsule biosynthesis protein)